jgi:hypothetical protein
MAAAASQTITPFEVDAPSGIDYDHLLRDFGPLHLNLLRDSKPSPANLRTDFYVAAFSSHIAI